MIVKLIDMVLKIVLKPSSFEPQFQVFSFTVLKQAAKPIFKNDKIRAHRSKTYPSLKINYDP